MVANQYLVCRAGADLVEFRHKDTGIVKQTHPISGLHCSIEVKGVLYLGTLYKKIFAINSSTL